MAVQIALTGDVMLGRLVDRNIIQNARMLPAGLWGDVLPLLQQADLRLVNLECVISTQGVKWHPLTKPFHFRATPRAIDVLQAARIDCVTLANNHILDYGPVALMECLTLLDQAGIPHTGAGRTLAEALAPAVLETSEGRLAVIALTDNEPAWEVTADRPGVHFIAHGAGQLLEPYRSRLHQLMSELRRQGMFVIVSAHIGPNWGKPSPAMQALAHELIDLGADLYWGHSNHTPQGMEVYRTRVILYSTGDFVDDYAIDPLERNDRSFLFMAEMRHRRVQRIHLHPVVIERCRVRRAQETEATWCQERMQALSAEFGSEVVIQNGVGELVVDG